jgi:hypothetical protein
MSRPELVREIPGKGCCMTCERERAALLCESRAASLAANGQPVAANEALKCAAAIRAMEEAA